MQAQDQGEKVQRPLSDREAKAFRAAAARCNYLAGDRPDLQFATKEVCRGMASPTEGCWNKLKQLVKYLKGRARAVQWFRWQCTPSVVTAFSDSDWAGCRTTRKSTSGGGIAIGSHVVKSWARTQATLATSSGEAELYAAVKAAAELLGIQSLAKDFGHEMSAELLVDAKATIGMVSRSGLGKLRHVEVGHLWIQEAVKNKRLRVKKVLGTENAADLMTKYLDKATIDKHMTKMGFEFYQ